jgi:hypothetical protein
LIYTPSWGSDSNSWGLINSWIPSGPSEQEAQLSISVPSAPGVYHFLFAFEWEIGGDHVASGSNWGLGYDVWGDGNDIAEFNAVQIAECQLNGYTEDEWLGQYGPGGTPAYILQNVPADALTLVVEPNQPPPPVLVINMYAGLTIFAPVGSTNQIQYVNNLNSTNWTTLTNLVLPTNPYVFVDYSSAGQPQRFYRDVLQ